MKHFALSIIAFVFLSCDETWFIEHIPNQIAFREKLSDYSIFIEPMSALQPSDGCFIYELNTPLFTDYARKQRVIKLPSNTKMKVQEDGNIAFPPGTIIVKTFYYDAESLKKSESHVIIETRLLLLHNEKWNVAVYQWNENQTDAFLIENGGSQSIQLLKKNGQAINFQYQIPSNSECTTCHQKNKSVNTIGPKVSNLNKHIRWNDHKINQLDLWLQHNLISSFDTDRIIPLPIWDNMQTDIHSRARAYLDVNCAHCHNPAGIAANWSLDLRFNTSLSETGILRKKHHLPARMDSNWDDEKMPKIGTELKHEEGIELVRQFINQL